MNKHALKTYIFNGTYYSMTSQEKEREIELTNSNQNSKQHNFT